jgi:hypothetical protein
MGAHFPLQSAGKRPAPPRPPRPLRHERMSAVEARALFPVGGGSGRKRGRFPVVAKARRTLDGIVFASKIEMERYAVLKQMEDVGLITDLRCQPFWDVEIDGMHLCRYTADFDYRDEQSNYVIEELKTDGTRKDASYRLRRKAAELAFGIIVTEVIR